MEKHPDPDGESHQDLIAEFHELARARWGGRSGPDPLNAAERAELLRLRAAAQRFRQQVLFGQYSALELLRICAVNLLHEGDYRNAGKALREIIRIEEKREKTVTIAH